MHRGIGFVLQEMLVSILIIFVLVSNCQATDGQLQLLLDSDFANTKIHRSAQASIKRLLNGSRQQRHIAKHLYENIVNGALAGIYPVDHKLPELRGMWAGKRWQTLLQDKASLCWKQPEGHKPIILINSQVINDSQMLDVSLIEAYLECGFRELDVIVKKQISDPFIPCVGEESSVFVYSPVTDVLINPACRTDENGVCHFSLPPAVYLFEVSCNNDPTSPEVIFRTVKAGDGIHLATEGFNNLYWMPQKWDEFKNQD